MKVWVILLAGLVLGLGGCAGDDGCRLARVATLPIRMVGRVPVVPVEINGQPAQMVLDTGADATVLGRRAAARLGVATEAGEVPLQGAGGLARGARARVERMALGGAAVTPGRGGGVPVVVTDDLPPPIDGLLGVGALLGFEVELDVPRGRVTFWTARSCVVGGPAWTGPYQPLPAQATRAGPLFVPVTLDGQMLRGMLDSGSAQTMLSLQSAEDAGLRGRGLAVLPARRDAAVNPGGLVARQAPFQTLVIGQETFQHPVLAVSDLPGVADLVIGEDYLGTRPVWFWFRLGKVFVAPAEAAGALDSVPARPL